MLIKTVEIYGLEVTGQGALGGDITEPVLLATGPARLTPWTASPDETVGNASRLMERSCIFRFSVSRVEGASFVKVQGKEVDYEVIQIVDLKPRGCSLRIRGAK